MAIDMMTGEHYCLGLYLGSGCESCRKKYPHIKPLPPEERERFLDAGIATLSGAIEQMEGGEPLGSSQVVRLKAITNPDGLNPDGSIPMVEHEGTYMTGREFYARVMSGVNGVGHEDKKGRAVFHRTMSAVRRVMRFVGL